ncbi:BnaA08g24310D [Brassica napus]|uniref:BnaA08g24310D protein n=1 Tax=Brassica napus TaxID=3708 RepID=A0A078G6R1_BRANA|nr:BnaA08g24310D [Brassica napus]
MAEETLTRTDSAEPTDKKRVRDESDGAILDSPEVKRLRDDLFDVFDDSDPEPVSQDLDSVMKSFEDELSSAQPPGETQPDLGYLLEASDDELGLPPPVSVVKEVETTETVADLLRASSDSSGIDELWGFEDHAPDYGSLDFGSGGLFDFSGECFDSGDLFSWRSESLPAE